MSAKESASALTITSIIWPRLVVTIIYRGTNADHAFSLQSGACEILGASRNVYQIAAEVLDSQWKDEAVQTCRKTVHFGMASLSYRPAQVTLRAAPRYIATAFVPALPASPQ